MVCVSLFILSASVVVYKWERIDEHQISEEKYVYDIVYSLDVGLADGMQGKDEK